MMRSGLQFIQAAYPTASLPFRCESARAAGAVRRVGSTRLCSHLRHVSTSPAGINCLCSSLCSVFSLQPQALTAALTTYQSTPLLALSLPLYVIDSMTHCCAVAKGGDEGALAELHCSQYHSAPQQRSGTRRDVARAAGSPPYISSVIGINSC
ncbi:hypothetical protein KOW79_022711 [Hemibagrus wyckioides]|uniref:Uncharacterized protein n=1 Tax=Hemibagrus wyckioides TaxID=337641 RepID=A0A9D3N2E4_9TELE|nr:hypothetical protein KOW79_022711 [Hemibagrus wyckioides]